MMPCEVVVVVDSVSTITLVYIVKQTLSLLIRLSSTLSFD